MNRPYLSRASRLWQMVPGSVCIATEDSRPRRVSSWLAIVALLLAVTPIAHAQTTDAKTRLVNLLGQLHSTEPGAADAARSTLTQMGLGEADIKTGWRLTHPDAGVRRQLAKDMAQSPSAAHVDLLLHLSRDDDRKVRMDALDAIRVAPKDGRLTARVNEMAKSDPDTVIKGNARLLSVEAGLGASPPVGRKSASVPSNAAPFQNPVAAHFDKQPVPVMTEPKQSAPAVTRLGTEQPRSFNPKQFEAPPETRTLPPLVQQQQQQLAPVQPFWNQPDGAQPAGGAPGSYWDKEPDNGILLVDGEAGENGVEPGVLSRPFDTPFVDDPQRVIDASYEEGPPFDALPDLPPPNGYAGWESIIPREEQSSNHFVPFEDRWRIPIPEWDRYDRGHPWVDDYPWVKGRWYDPYNQNVFKGDYPIIGQHTFMNVTIQNRNITMFQQVPTATTPFESTERPFQEEFFGNPRQFQNINLLSAQFDLLHGSQLVFKPLDWQVRLQPIFNRNYIRVKERAVVNPDVRKEARRTRHDFSLEQWFVEAKLADLGPEYDFMSIRAGSQFFTSDFRGFVFSDVNRGVRLFGTQFGNRDQFNLVYFDQTEKETNSQLNTWDDRHQNTVIANYFRQDFIFPGYTFMLNYHYNHEQPSFKFDENNILVRPDPVGVFEPHRVQAHYFGINGDGHIGRINITHAFYWAVGHDSKNPLANEKQDIWANMQAIELSIDRDWMRFRTSYFHSSGDDDVFDDEARGFDTILDNPNFAGGEFSYWQRQPIRLFGVNIVQNNSIVPNLRSSKIQGQTNFVNPGLNLVNVGVDFEVTPKMKLITNANYLWFDTTHPLEIFTFQDNIDPEIGTDLSLGIEYRPFLNDNVIILAGFSTLIPGKGFDDLFGTAIPELLFGGDADIETQSLYSNFVEVILEY